jgi:serine protease Do
VGGDSGGPLVDLNGLVVGIHSRIGGRLWENYHVPIDVFSIDWDELAKGAIVGSARPYIGIELERAPIETNKVKRVVPNEAADLAGMQDGDIIIKINDTPIANSNDIRDALRTLKPRDTATIVVRRGEEELQLEVTLGYQ